MKYYKEGGTKSIDGNNPQEISLAAAFREIDDFVFNEGNFIGFINDKEKIIQFIRFEMIVG